MVEKILGSRMRTKDADVSRIIIEKQSDLVLRCLSMPFWQVTSVDFS